MAQTKNYDALPDDARVSSSEVGTLIAKSKATVFRLVAIGQLPRTQSVPPGTRPTHRLGDVRKLLRPAPPPAAKTSSRTPVTSLSE